MSKDNPTHILGEAELTEELEQLIIDAEKNAVMASPKSTIEELIGVLITQNNRDGTDMIDFDVDGTKDGKPIYVHIELSVHEVGKRSGRH